MAYLKWIILGALVAGTIGAYVVMVPLGVDGQIKTALTGPQGYDYTVKTLDAISKDPSKIYNQAIADKVKEYRDQVAGESQNLRDKLKGRTVQYKDQMGEGLGANRSKPASAPAESLAEWISSNKTWYTGILDNAVRQYQEQPGWDSDLTPPDMRAVRKGARALGADLRDLAHGGAGGFFTPYGRPADSRVTSSSRPEAMALINDRVLKRVYLFWEIHRILGTARVTVTEPIPVIEREGVKERVVDKTVPVERRVEEIRGIDWGAPRPGGMGGGMSGEEYFIQPPPKPDQPNRSPSRDWMYPYRIIPFTIDFVAHPALVPKIISMLQQNAETPGGQGSHFLIEVVTTEINRIGERSRETQAGGGMGMPGMMGVPDHNPDKMWIYKDYEEWFQQKSSLPVQVRLECWAYDFSSDDAAGK
jgi:hypothetical protein